MKKILILIAFFATQMFAAEFEDPRCNVRPGTELIFPSDYLTFQFGDACSQNFIKCIKDTIDGWPPFMGFSYYSTLDTNFVVFVNLFANRITIFRTYKGLFLDANNKTLKEILRHEFMNLQEWNSIDISKDSAETLIDKVVFIMLGGSSVWENMEDSAYTAYTGDIGNWYYHDAESEDTFCCAQDVDSDASMIDNWWTLLPDEKPTSISKTRIKNRFRLSRMNHETFFVEGINEATPYKVFDVNGILLKQGLVQNGVVQVPKTPSIIDIAHQNFLLK